jgi:hypothetical protein
MHCRKCSGHGVVRWTTGEHVECPICRGTGAADDCCGTPGSNQPNTFADVRQGAVPDNASRGGDR